MVILNLVEISLNSKWEFGVFCMWLETFCPWSPTITCFRVLVQKFQVLRWTPTLRELLVGTYDPGHNSVLSLLRGYEDSLIRHIYSYQSPDYARHLKLTIPAGAIGKFRRGDIVRFNTMKRTLKTISVPRKKRTGKTTSVPPKCNSPCDYVAWTKCGKIEFPTPDNRNVNMMPFIYGDISSLPSNLRCYEACINACPIPQTDIGKFFYLTVHESYVEPESTQRRAGLHIEAPGTFREDSSNSFSPGREHHWGMGMFYEPDKYEGRFFDLEQYSLGTFQLLVYS